MIWDPEKPFNCLCKKDTKERSVKKVIIILINMKAYIRNLKAHIYPHITTKSPFIRNHVFLTNQ
jgi:hypothetical protein